MTELELEIQELRREVKKLKLENDDLKHIHQLDQAEIVYLRRRYDAYKREIEVAQCEG